MVRLKQSYSITVIIVSCLLLRAPCFAQLSPESNLTETSPEQTQSVEQKLQAIKQQRNELQVRLDALEGSALEESDLRKATEFYQQASLALSKHEEQLRALQEFDKKIEDYPQVLASFKERLAVGEKKQEVTTSSSGLVELEAEVVELETAVQKFRESLVKSEAEPKTRAGWIADLPKRVSSIQEELDEVNLRLATLKQFDANDIKVIAEHAYLMYQQAYLQASLNVFEKQRRYYGMSSELLQIKRDYNAKRLSQLEKVLTTFRDEISKRREQEAEQQAAKATEAAQVERPEAVAVLAKRNAELAADQAEIVSATRKLRDEFNAVTEQLEKVSKEFTRSKERIGDLGLSEAIGQQLRQQEELLPNLGVLERQIALHRKLKAEATYKLYELYDQRSTVADSELDDQVEQILTQVEPEKREEVAGEVKELIQSERTILSSIIDNYEAYSRQLIDIVAVESNLTQTTRDYAEFITKNVTWIRSCSIPTLDDIQPAFGALTWSLRPENWWEVVNTFQQRMQNSPITGGVFLMGVCILIFLQQRLRIYLKSLGEAAEKRTCTEFSLSLKAAVCTFLLAIPWPALLWFLGWWLDKPLTDSEFVRSIGPNLKSTAYGLFILELIRQVCRTRGLAESHFEIPGSCVRQLRWNTRLLLWVGLPLAFWLTGLEIQREHKLFSSTLGRAFFVVVMMVFAWSAYRVLMAKGSPCRQVLTSNSQKKHWNVAKIWIPLVFCLPIALAVLAIVGYYYTAQRLSIRMLHMIAMMLVLLVLGGLTKRWILMNRRRLAREQARQKRAAEAASAEGDEQAPLPPELIEETVDFAALGQQTNRLVKTVLIVVGIGLSCFIWKEMLPALSLIGEQTIPGFALQWGQLIKFVLVCAVTYVAVSNVPALLEFAVLQHLPIDSGLRYAITSICRYTLLAMGIYLAYDALGFDSTSIQWLVAAMGVGLGFGLQEIFANFVSGIILLFERPVRVGDIITFGDKTGVVNRIRMRATTITDWDRKEYVVPNKDLVTERLLNWTLSDQTNRIVIPVGVAYGSDTDLACQLLLEVAAEHPLILDDPTPMATFEGFGDSTLNLILRSYLPNLEKRLHTIHDLHTMIDRKFKEAGLEIAFPQLDLHVRDVPKGVQSVLKESPPSSHANGNTSG